MFVIFLRFSRNKGEASRLMDGHKAWIQEGVRDGIFHLVGSLAAGAGGAILAHGEARSEIEARVARDPFVVEDVVTAQIHEVAPSLASAHMQHMLA